MSNTKHEFKTDIVQLLDLIANSLYSHQEIFLRELISNASDAIDKARFDALTDTTIAPENPEYKIEIIPDEAQGILTIRDNGIGMNEDEINENLGTIARSGTKAFIEALKANKGNVTPELIGQFGVGFYSAFMVADKIEVYSLRRGENQTPMRWVCSMEDGGYTVEDCEKDTHGTDIVLYLKEDAKEYMTEWRIKEIVKKYSDFIEFPITMDITREIPEKDEEGKPIEGKTKTEITNETLNNNKAIWLRPKSDISEEEYKEFYKQLTNDYQDPLINIHYNAEGAQEFKSILYIPSKAPFNMFMQNDAKTGIKLYIKKVFITDTCEDIIPRYLRFVKGVVDSADLPLNVSREMLQKNATLKKIEESLTRKIISTLKDMIQKDREKYLEFYNEFGNVIKEGVSVDFTNKDKLLELLMYKTSKRDELISLQDYETNMPEDQKEIYYLTGEDIETMKKSPLLEAFAKKNYEVIFMSDPIDEWVISSVQEFHGKKLKCINQGEIDLGDDEETKEENKKLEEKFTSLLEKIGDILKDDISSVRFSHRLTDSPVCLVGEEGGISDQMAKVFAAMKQFVPESKKILELNPHHQVVEKMQNLFESDQESSELVDYSKLLYNEALMLSGAKPKDPADLSRIINSLLLK